MRRGRGARRRLGEDADPAFSSGQGGRVPGDRGDESGLTGSSVRLSEEDDSGLGWK